MRYLLDSNVLVWWVCEPEELSSRVYTILSAASNELVVSYVSLWELSIKIGKGRLVSAGSSIQYLMDEIDSQGMTLLPIQRTHILRAESLPPHHRDPFDRMLIAQALAENLPVLTSDTMFAAYGVQVVWQ